MLYNKTPFCNTFKEIILSLKLEVVSIEELFHLYESVARQIFERKSKNETLIVGISGAQGSGKTTFAAILKKFLENQFSWKIAQISLDDYYLSHQQRQILSQTIHPLLCTRGVPGTHDVEMLQDTLQKLSHAESHESTIIRRFNKLTDDPLPKSNWDSLTGQADVVLFEGWCLGAEPQNDETLQTPINDLEQNEDSNCIWRAFVNNQLRGCYSSLFNCIQFMIFLNIPSFEKVYEWRWLQEQNMAEENGKTNRVKIMNQQELKKFVAHYERITRHLLEIMPEKANIVLQLDENHQLHYYPSSF